MTVSPDEPNTPDDDPNVYDPGAEPSRPVTEPDVEGDEEVVAPDPVADA